MDILEEILKAKEKYIKREKGLQEELKALNDTKSVYEKSSKSSSNSNKSIIVDLEKKINEYEILLQKWTERRKEIAQKITTIKSSNTKISKKEKLISDRIQEIAIKINLKEENQNKEEIDSSVIQNLASLIEILKEYKKQGIISIPTIDTLETHLQKLDNESLKKLKQQMQSAIRIIKGAVKAKSNAIEKFNILIESKKVNVKKVNDAQSKKAKSKAAVSETLAIEDDTKPVSEEVVWFDGKSTEEPIMQSKKVKNMLLKNIAINNNKNVKSCCIIKIMEGKQKVEVDGKEIELNRHLDIETENKVDKICKRFIHINENPTNEQTNELKRLKKYIDPAVVNAIKDSLFSKSNLDKWNRAITKVKNLKYSNRINERIKKLQQEEIDEIALKIIEENNQAVDEYYMAKKIYAETLTEYIKSVYMADKTDMLFLPFGDLVYECPRNMSTREYNKIDNYLKAAENIGGRVFGKRSFFGLIKEKIVKNKNISFERENLQQKGNKEGDKSFVEKVETSKKIDENQEQRPGSVTFISSFKPKTTRKGFIGGLTLE